MSVEAGKTYRLSVYGRASDGSVAYLYVKNGDENPAVSFRSTEVFAAVEPHSPVSRSMIFTAKSDSVEIGFAFMPVNEDTFALLDDFRLCRVEEESAGRVSLSKDGLGRQMIAVTSAAYGEEVYLRLYYRNTGAIFAVGNLVRNKESRGAVCFAKVGAPGHFAATEFTQIDSVLVPLTIEAGRSNYRMDMLKGEVTITGAELVRISDRF